MQAHDAPYLKAMSKHFAHTNPDQIETADGGIWASVLRVVSVLTRPELKKWRPVMALAVVLTLVAKVLSLIHI